jgi:hypothetical protein
MPNSHPLINCLEVTPNITSELDTGQLGSAQAAHTKVLYIYPEPGYVVQASDFTDYTLETYPEAGDYLDLTWDSAEYYGPGQGFSTVGAMGVGHITITDTGTPLNLNNSVMITVHIDPDFVISGNKTLKIDIGGEAQGEGTDQKWLVIGEEFSNLRNILQGDDMAPGNHVIIERPFGVNDVTFFSSGILDSSFYGGKVIDDNLNTQYQLVDEFPLAQDTYHFFQTFVNINSNALVATITMTMEDNFHEAHPNYNDSQDYYSIDCDMNDLSTAIIIDNDWNDKFTAQPRQINNTENSGGSKSAHIETATGGVDVLTTLVLDVYYQETFPVNYNQYQGPQQTAPFGNGVEFTNPNTSVFVKVRGKKTRLLEAETDGNVDWVSGDSGGVNMKSITKVVTKFANLPNSNADHIIPSIGIPRDAGAGILEIYGTPGAEFAVSLRESRFVEISEGSPRSSFPDTPTVLQQDGGSIPWMENKYLIIPSSGVYSLPMPYIAPLTITDGWKEFEMVIGTNSETIYEYVGTSGSQHVTHRGTDILNSAVGASKFSSLDIAEHIYRLTNTLIQYPNVSIKLDAIKDSDWTYTSGFNITDVKQYGKLGIREWGNPLALIGYNVDYEIRLYDETTTFSLADAKANYKNSTEIANYTVDPAEHFIATYPDNEDIVSFSPIRVHVGEGVADTNNDYATATGSIYISQFGLQTQTYTIDFTKIFNNS